MMAAFSPAIVSSVSPRKSTWSMEIGVMTLASGAGTTLVASSRPPSPTSSSSASAGWSANSRKAAAVSISNTVIGRIAVGALAGLQRRDEFGVRHQHAAARSPEPETLVHAHQVGRGIHMDARAGRFEHGAHERDGRSLAVGAGDVDDRRQRSSPGGRARSSTCHMRSSERSMRLGWSVSRRARISSMGAPARGSGIKQTCRVFCFWSTYERSTALMRRW